MSMGRRTMNGRFAGKCAIVTGGSSGIGLAVVEELCAEGAAVVFTCLEEREGREVERRLRQSGLRAHYVQGDMGDEAFCRRCVAEAAAAMGAVHYLVNNAFSFVGRGLEAGADDWARSYGVGPIGYARMAQHCAPHMQSAGGGAIVNVSSISAHIAQPQRWTYNSAKGAVHAMTKCQALDLAPYGIRVNSVSPGWIWTRETDRSAGLDGGGRDKWEPIWGAFHMLARCGEPAECAGPILFLLSDDASFVTGADLPVDGGYLALGPEGLGRHTVNVGSE
ncbi:SDR family oxidoreductase [Paenibacillus sp. IB182496]|uniref:SDR family oxidoreductase n=1 Tax=Paenibacillus sabuli TaxID=2772509 RepID=A0A927BNK6_9BACL|nr:SDR family oxidoreductase [Paenibacillus sabuli]MBD2843838.1 SDR family oxidoreductase [Paenibacillus sabuli]